MPLTPATWLDAVAVNTTATGTRADPKVTVLSNGNILITWTAIGEDFSTQTIGLILDPLGNPVTEEFSINQSQSSGVEVTATADGGFIAVFERQNGGYEEVFITSFDETGAPSPSVRLFNDPNRDADPGAFDPAIAIGSPDSGLTIWRQVNAEGESVIRAYLFDPSASDPFQTVSSARFNLITEPDIQGEPAITALANGNYAVAVTVGAGDDTRILLYLVDQNGAVSPAKDHVIDAAGLADHAPVLTALPGGDFVMAWVSGDALLVQRFQSNGNDRGDLISVPGVTVSGDTPPAIHAFAAGGYAVVFLDGASGQVMIQRFNGDGDPVGDLAVVDAAGGDASAPGVSLLPDGRMVVTFIGASGDVVMEILDTRDAPGEAGNTFTGTAGDDVIEYSGDAVFVGGGAGDDVITATAGGPARTYDGGDGDDLLIASEGADTFIGGAGVDTLSYADASRRVYVDLLFNNADDGAAGDSFESIENLIGSAFDDIMFGGNADNVIHGGDGNDALIGDGGDDILHGEAGNDELFGDEGNDTLFGGEGDDRLEGGEGADILDGGDGFDTVSYDEDDADLRVDLSTGVSSDGDTLISIEGVLGGYGDDELIGDDRDNHLSGSYGDDLIRGGAGADTLFGGGGIDTVSYAGSSAGVTVNLSNNTASGGDAEGDVISEFENILGSSFDDVLTGNAGGNVLDGGAGADRMGGGAGDDTYHVDHRDDVVVEVAGGGVDTVFSTVSFDARATHVENLRAQGSAALNLVGNALDNDIIGNDAANIIKGGGGADHMEGLGGDDTYYVDSRDDVVIEVAGGGVDTVFSTVSFDARFTHVENLRAQGSAALNLVGNDLDNDIIGNDAANIIKGGGGADRMEGLGGDDTYFVDSLDDVVIEVAGGGVDTVISTVGFDARFTHVENITLTGDVAADVVANDLNNIIIGNSAANIINGGAGADRMEGQGGDDIYYVDSRDDVVIEVEGGGVDTVFSTVSFDARFTHVENITLTGDDNANAVGNDLNNVIRGNGGANILKGLGGDDTYFVDSRDDVVVEVAGGGIDTVFSTVSFDARATHVENITLVGDANANAVGNDLDNIIIGNDTANIIKGGGGGDRMEGLGGDDTYFVDSRDDVVIEVEGGGVDTVFSTVSFDARFTHVENITLQGGANANAVANDLANIIIGNSASNIIIGNGGADHLTGGGGSDTFKYNAVSDSSFADYDRIMDLGADDFIDLRNIDANVNVAGNQSFTQVDELTGEAGQLTLTWLPSAGFTLLSADVDGDGVADMRIVLYGDHSDFDNFLGVGG